MVQASVDDGQVLMALNEIYIGQPTHQTARYTLTIGDGTTDGITERQASSGLIVCTGTGATGWGRSTWLERHSSIDLPAPTEGRLAWFVREAWPSPVTGVNCTEGVVSHGQSVGLVAESDRLVAFGDGIESERRPRLLGPAHHHHPGPNHPPPNPLAISAPWLRVHPWLLQHWRKAW